MHDHYDVMLDKARAVTFMQAHYDVMLVKARQVAQSERSSPSSKYCPF